MYCYFQQFEHFDPLTGDIPAYPFAYLPNITARARHLLDGRKTKQIIAAAIFIDWTAYQETERIKKLLSKESENLKDEMMIVDEDDYMYAFKQCYKQYTLNDDPEFPDGSDYEYFAVLALWLVADAVDVLEYERLELNEALTRLTPKENQLDTDNLTITDDMKINWLIMGGDFSMKAMEAVCYAEHLWEIAELQKQPDSLNSDFEKMIEARAIEKITYKKREAALKGHKRDHQQQADALEIYEKIKDDFNSINAAAKEIAKTIHREPDTIAKWIRANRRK